MGKRKWKRRAKAWGETVTRQSEHIVLLTERLDKSEAAARKLQENLQTQVDEATGLQRKLDEATRSLEGQYDVSRLLREKLAEANQELEATRGAREALERLMSIIEPALPETPGVIVKDPGDRWPDLRPIVRRLRNEVFLALKKFSPTEKRDE